MNQNDLNKIEWENDGNWTTSTWVGFYFSKKDCRIWVPKRKPILGWTLNLAHTGGAVWLFAIVAILIIASASIGYHLAILSSQC